MKTIHLMNLVIETTRKCNIQCAHCLRGDAECKNFDVKYLEMLLKQDIEISSITLSGGEPSLVVGVLKQIRETFDKYSPVGLSSFYLATNGVDISEEFIIEMVRWYSFCIEKENCALDISNDQFHSDEMSYNTEMLNALSFAKMKFAKTEYYDGVREGRNENNGNARPNDDRVNIEHDDEVIRVDSLYLNCNGDVIRSCDLSYESQDLEENIYCKVSQVRERVEGDFDNE